MKVWGRRTFLLEVYSSNLAISTHKMAHFCGTHPGWNSGDVNNASFLLCSLECSQSFRRQWLNSFLRGSSKSARVHSFPYTTLSILVLLARLFLSVFTLTALLFVFLI